MVQGEWWTSPIATTYSIDEPVKEGWLATLSIPLDQSLI